MNRDRRQKTAARLQGDPMRSDHDHDPDLDHLDALVDAVPDDQLRLMFLCCHPSLAPDAQVALTLRLLGGLQTAEIARAFLVPEVTMAQRLVRANRKLRDNHAPYRIPSEAELPDRLDAVLGAIYLVYTEGHTSTSGSALIARRLSAEAIRLGRVLAQLMPDEPEATGLLALMLLTQARQPARVGADGTLVRLAEQDRTRWDGSLIDEGHRAGACMPALEPTGRLSDPGGDRSGARGCVVIGGHRLVTGAGPLRPTSDVEPKRRRGSQPSHCGGGATRAVGGTRRTRGRRHHVAR